MNYIVDKKKVGAYLKKLVKENQYPSNRQFGKACLKMMGCTDPDDVELNRMNNRLSQICNGQFHFVHYKSVTVGYSFY